MDQLHDLALGVAQRILAAGTEAERYELGVEEEDCSSGEDLMELAIQVLMNGVKITQRPVGSPGQRDRNCWHSLCRERRSPHSWAAGTPCALKQERKLGRRCRCRTCPYLNNVVEQDHRGIKRRVNASQGFRSFDGAWRTIQGYEVLHMIRKGQVRSRKGMSLGRFSSSGKSSD